MEFGRKNIDPPNSDKLIIAVLAVAAIVFFALSALILVGCYQSFQEFGHISGLQFDGLFSFAMFSAATAMTFFVKSGRTSFREGRRISSYLLLICLLGIAIFFAVDAYAKTQPSYFAYGVPYWTIVSMAIISLTWLYFDHCLKLQSELDSFV